MPTEAELANRFNVNRHTVGRALGLLREEGFVFSKKGSGVFVTAKNATYHIGKRTRFSQNISSDGVPSRTITSVETRHATSVEAGKLTIQASEMVHVAEGLGYVENMPIMHATSRFPLGAARVYLHICRSIPPRPEPLPPLALPIICEARQR